MQATHNKEMINESQNSPAATPSTNENKVPSILVHSVTKGEHERNKKQVKFHKTQIPKASSIILNKPNAETVTTNKLSPTTITNKKTKQLITRTASWSEGSTESSKSCLKTIKKLERTTINTSNNIKIKGMNGTVNKPQKARRNSLQLMNCEKHNKESVSLQVKVKGARSRSKSPNIQKKPVESECDKNGSQETFDQNSERENTMQTLSISEKLLKFDELLAPKSLTRRKSLESVLDPVTQNIKVIAHFMPRRRFSQGAVSALKQVLESVDENDTTNGDEKHKEGVDPEDFSQLSREEQLRILEGKSWVKNIDFNPSSSDIKSLTGGKKAKWKFQDSFYGNFNVGRRPSQDTAWGRRFGLDGGILLTMFCCAECLISMRLILRLPNTGIVISIQVQQLYHNIR